MQRLNSNFTRPRSLVFVTCMYAALVWGGHVLFSYLGHLRGDAESGARATTAFAGMAILCWLVSCVAILFTERGRR